MRTQININRTLTFISGGLIFLWMDPYFAWRLSDLKFFIYTIPLCVIFFSQTKTIKNTEIGLWLFFAVILFIAAFCARSSLAGTFAMLILVTIPFVPPEFLKSTYKYFKTIYGITIIISLVVWGLALSGVPIPYKIIPPLNALKEYNYCAYPFLVTLNVTDLLYIPINVIRFCGLYDEPGVVGTISLLILFIERFDLRSKLNIGILIAGLCSLSLFFYLACFIYLIYYVIVVGNNLRNRIVFVVLIASFVVFTQDNVLIKTLIWDRISWNETEGTIAGDNRASEDFKNYFNSIVGTATFYWGEEDKNMSLRFSESAGYRNAVLRYGAVSGFLYLLFFVLFAYNRISDKKQVLIFAAILTTTLYQRPNFFAPHYMFLFTMCIIFFSQPKNETHLLPHK